MRTSFLVVENLVADMLLGTAFVNKIMKSMYPKHGVVVSTESYPVALETQPDALSQANTVECPESQVNLEQVPVSSSIGKQKTIPGLLKTLVSVRTSEIAVQLVSTNHKLT